MDRWESLQTEVNRRLATQAEELAALIKDARDDALIDELGKITSTLAKMEQRLAALEDRLPEDEDA